MSYHHNCKYELYNKQSGEWKTRVEDSWIQVSNTVFWLAGWNSVWQRKVVTSSSLEPTVDFSNYFDALLPKHAEPWGFAFSETSGWSKEGVWNKVRICTQHVIKLGFSSFWQYNSSNNFTSSSLRQRKIIL